jgi:hypothetical protein
MNSFMGELYSRARFGSTGDLNVARIPHPVSGYFQRSIACRCSDSGGSSSSSIRMPCGSVTFDKIAFVPLPRVSETFAPRCLKIAVAAPMFSTCTPKWLIPGGRSALAGCNSRNVSRLICT